MSNIRVMILNWFSFTYDRSEKQKKEKEAQATSSLPFPPLRQSDVSQSRGATKASTTMVSPQQRVARHILSSGTTSHQESSKHVRREDCVMKNERGEQEDKPDVDTDAEYTDLVNQLRNKEARLNLILEAVHMSLNFIPLTDSCAHRKWKPKIQASLPLGLTLMSLQTLVRTLQFADSSPDPINQQNKQAQRFHAHGQSNVHCVGISLQLHQFPKLLSIHLHPYLKSQHDLHHDPNRRQ